MDDTWFETKQVSKNIYLTNENKFFEGNRSNIWLIKGPGKDVIIDAGLGVCDLRAHLERNGLISPPGSERECILILTHAHFDHSGGAHHFDKVYIHERDQAGLINGRQTETLNYVKPAHFHSQPFHGFSALQYKVPPTQCEPLKDGELIDIGSGEYLQILHTPGHTKGSMSIYHPNEKTLYSGDFVYECGSGSGFLDWLPTSCVRDYSRSCEQMIDFLGDHEVARVFPGHFRPISTTRTLQLLGEYIEDRNNCGTQGCMTCLQCTTFGFFLMGCFRCCPC